MTLAATKGEDWGLIAFSKNEGRWL